MRESRPWTWPRLVAVTLARAVLAGLLGLAAWGALPALAGWHPTTVSSGSMMPRLHVGDVAVSRPLRTAQVPPLGSVLLFEDPDHPDRLRMHRFVRAADDGRLVTRGDANLDDDSTPVALGAIRGIGTLRVPWVALPVVWLREGRWLNLLLVAGAVGLLLAVASSGRDRSFGEDDPPEDPGPDGPGPVGDSDDAARDRLVGAAHRRESALLGGGDLRQVALFCAVLLAATVSTPSGAAFSSTVRSNAALTAAPYFSCAGAVAALSPYLWYRMDETSSTTTTAADSSGGGRTGVYGAAGKTSTTSRACVRDTGRAMTFNGSSGYLSSPLIGSALPNTFSLAVWFRTTTKTGGKLMGFGNSQTGVSSSYDRHVYMTNTGRLVFGVYPGAVKTISPPASYNDGGWHLMVATLSAAGMRLYVDGDLEVSDPSVTSAEPVASGYLRVGYDNLDGWTTAPSSRYFAGTLDDAVVVPAALTAAQVAALYEAGTT